MSLPSLSVQLLQWGQTAFTVRAVDALFRAEYDGELEVLVYDNDSPGGPGGIADDRRVNLIRGDANIGFGPAHNRLAEEAAGELILILNNDTIVAPDSLARMVRRFGEGTWGAVTPQYRDFDGSVLEMGGYLGPAGEGWQLFRGMRPPASLRRMPFESAYGSGACLLLARDDFLRLGGFDDLFAPAYYEDTDICMKLAAEGKPTVVEPSAVVYHFEGATSGRDLSTGPKAFQVRNRARFLQRWSTELEANPPIDTDAALARILRPRPGRLRVLWIAPHLPRYDREAGHVRILKMIEALRSSGDAVGYWAEQCFHPERYGVRLEQMGVPWFGRSRSYRPGLPEPEQAYATAQSVLEAVPWDVVVISFPELASRMLPSVRRIAPGAAVLIDDVDLHFLRTQRGAEAGIEIPVVIDKATELDTYAASDGVITASPDESEVLGRELPGLPSWPFAVAAEPPTVGTDDAAQHLLFLGNFDHHPNVDAVMWWVEEIAEQVAQRAGREIPLRVVGAGSERFEQLAGGRHAAVDLGGWVPDLSPEFHRARVFLAPLRYGAGTKGKILNAMSHGVPVVTTTVGAEGNDESIVDCMRVADDAGAIAGHVAALMSDPGEWAGARAAAIDAGRQVWDRQKAVAIEFAEWVRRRAAR